MDFGPLAKELRIQKRLTLRKFCEQLGLDPSNWSKIERGVNQPPKDEGTLSHWADFFELKDASRQQFLDAASVARKELPADMLADEELRAKLPAFFRAMRGQEPSDEALTDLVEEVRKLHSRD